MMAWTVPQKLIDGDPLTAAQMNTLFTRNFEASSPGVSTTAGRMIVSDNVNSVVERQWARQVISSEVTCTREWPSDPDEADEEVPGTAGPSVTFEHGGTFLAIFSVRIQKTSSGGMQNYGPVIEGGDPGTPAPNRSIRTNDSIFMRSDGHMWFTAPPGLSTVTMKYGWNGSESTGVFAQRRLTVWPF